MDDIVNIIYSEKNLSKLSEKFTSFFDDIGDSQNAQNACKTWLRKKMTNIIDQNKNNLRGNKKDVIKKLNSDCLKTAVNEYRSHQTSKTTGQNLNNYRMQREKDVHGNRKVRVEKRPKYREENNLGTLADTGGYANFSQLNAPEGEFIGADGTLGKKMFFGNINDMMQNDNKKAASDDLERRMMMRKSDYDGGMDMGNMGGMSRMNEMGGMGRMNEIGGMGGNGMDNFNPTMYNPNLGQNKRPQEINFRLDGSDSRYDMQQNQNQNMNGMEQLNTMGFDGMNMNGMNQMDFNQMGMFNQYGMDQPNMNQMGMQNMNQMRMQNMNQMGMQNMNQMGMQNMNQMGMQNMNQMEMQNMNDSSRQYDNRAKKTNNQNYSMGGRDRTNDNLANKVNQMRNHIATNIGLDPQALLHMSSEDIEAHIKKQAKKPNKYESESGESSDSDNNNSEDEKEDKKARLLKMLIDMKKNNSNKTKGLKKAVDKYKKKNKKDSSSESEESSEEQSDDSVDEKPTTKSTTKSRSNIDKTKKNVKFAEKLEEHQSDKSDESSDSEIKKSSKTKKTNIKKEQPVTKTKKEKCSIKISPDESSDGKDLDSKYYSDFMIDLKQKFDRNYTNLSNISLKIKKLESIQPEITESCNKLNIIIGNETKKIELDDGFYSLDDLVEGISENLEDVNIVCKRDKKGRVIIENTESDDFIIDCSEDSFGKYLGFTEDRYENSSKYISEESSMLLNDSIYIYFPNIIPNKPFCRIDNEKNIKLLYPKQTIEEIDCLIIQIKNSETEEEIDFHNFTNKFEFELTFECDKE